MPRWMLRCPKCHESFPHAAIDRAIVEQAFRDPFRVIPKPAFDQQGHRQICPGCKTESVFQQHQLFYRDDTADFNF